MFFCAKKIVYLSLYDRGERIGSAGFAGIYGEREEVRIVLQVRNAGEEAEGEYPVSLILRGQEAAIGKIALKRGSGNYERRFGVDKEGMIIGSLHAAEGDLDAVCMVLDGERSVRGIWKKVKEGREREPGEKGPEKTERDPIRREEGKVSERTVEKTRELEALQRRPGEEKKRVKEKQRRMEEETILYQPNYLSDKWEQMKKQYNRVHPFGDDREFVSIELKDFVVLREPCQRLINNSFLLHGFYNYRHLILGKDCRIGSESELCFYLGVPGVFFEREKMVAVMFGFEGFECAGPVEIGKFGYYLRRVEI